MGAWITFAEVEPNHWGVEHPDSTAVWSEIVPLSAFTADQQKAIYGISWEDCLALAADGTEKLGVQDDGGSMEPWYQPDWPLALARTRELMAKVEAAHEGHRKQYDSARMPAFAAAVERCAGRPEKCWVKWSY